MAIDTGTGLTAYVIGSSGTGSAAGGVIVHILANGSHDPASARRESSSSAPARCWAPSRSGDGNILVGGAASVTRLHVDGSPDAGFGSAGNAALTGMFDGVTIAQIVGLAVQTDGRIVLAAETSGTPEFVLIRLLPDGTVDPSYGSGGSVAIGAFDDVASLRLQPGNDALVCGSTTGGAAIARVTF